MDGFAGMGDPMLRGQAADAQRNANNAAQRAKQVENEVERLTLVCAAMWDLMKERLNVSEQDLAEKMAIIDARNGVADGRLTHRIRPCAKCGRTLAPRHSKCMYCGAEQPANSVFETL